MSREAVGFWAAHQSADVVWPCAAICGVGAAIDYTINRGFMVALLVGFEGLQPPEEGAMAERRLEKHTLRKRQAAAQALASEGKQPGTGGPAFGARVHTITSGASEVKLAPK